MDSIAFWRRLDVPGHDACRVAQQPDGGWHLDGSAVFLEDRPSTIAYHVVCDACWLFRSASVSGMLGELDVAADIRHDEGGAWTVDGLSADGLDDCLDLDLGFTPATNLIAIRRLALTVGQAAQVPAAWFDLPVARLERLEQRYERRGETAYWYESPRFGYAELLEVGPEGFVRSYPGLWEALEVAGSTT